MVNPQLFQTRRGALLPPATARNHHGAPAYGFGPQHALAQMAATGCLNTTFYADGARQLTAVKSLAPQVATRFLAQAAIHARQAGHMKDMPALLAAMLAKRDVALLQRVFGRIIDDGKMLRNFVQIVRSGVTGRKSLGARPKKLVQQWLLDATETQLLHAAVGRAPSLADVVKMVHPKPREPWREAWFAWLIGKPFDEAALPPLTQAFERFKRAAAAGEPAEVPDVPFQMLTALSLTAAQWAQIARAGSWQMVRQNLNTFARHGVFQIDGMTEAIASKLRDPAAVSHARALPYQLMAAGKASLGTAPPQVQLALQDALDLALANVPAITGQVVVCPDVSGSMHAPVTGHRGSATTTVRCIDAAALVAAAVLHHNPQARVLPFRDHVVPVTLNPRDSVMTNTQRLSELVPGGTDCSAPLAWLNRERAPVDFVILISDHESWIDWSPQGGGRPSPACWAASTSSGPIWPPAIQGIEGPTATMREWAALKQRCPQARLACIDLVPHATTQAVERADILHVGGFSDAVFATLKAFVDGQLDPAHWVGEVARVPLDAA